MRSVIDITSDLVAPQILEQNDYLPYGTKIQNPNLAAIPMNNRWRYAGKEAQRFGSLDLSLLDFGARMYDSFMARWTAADPMAKDYLPLNPYSYCLLNPVSFTDPNGKAVPIIVVMLAKGTATALFDAGTQVAVHMIRGDSLKDALGKVDLVSVGTSFVEGTLNIPGISTKAKALTIGFLRATDVAIDIKTEDGTKSIINGTKDISSVALDALGESAGLAWSDTVTQLAKNGIKADLTKGYFWTLKKDDQQYIRKLSEFINSDGFKNGAGILMDSEAGFIIGGLRQELDNR